METFIVVIAMIASAAGSLVLLACLASRRSELVKAFNLQRDMESDEQEEAATDSDEVPAMS